MRRVLGGTLLGFGADEQCVADILLAATEACTNVLKHGERCTEYEVSAKVRDDAFLLEIANGTHELLGQRPWNGNGHAAGNGIPFAAAPIPADTTEPAQLRESGRGLTIMRACVDDLTLSGTADRGTVVSMRKQITWAPSGHGRHAATAVPGRAAHRDAW
ncbi:MAG TPA: ATP-binding protein [Streptosporangiaceae bacterium]|nr:ATP-binding protein [Streptosporangiaceae bacterium]